MGEITFNLGLAKNKLVGLIEKRTCCIDKTRVNEWIQKLWHIYTMEFYAAERKKELIPFATA